MVSEQSPEIPEASALQDKVAGLEEAITRLRRERDDAVAALRDRTAAARTSSRTDSGIGADWASFCLDERQFDLILESATEYAIFTLDTEGRVTSWNAGARAILGWERDEILGRNADLIFTSEDQGCGMLETEMATALAGGRADDERWHVRKDGSRFWASGTLMPLRDPHVGGFLKILRDRTAERLADAEREELRRVLERERTLFRAVLERLPAGLIVSEAPSGRHLIHNARAEDLLGHAVEEITECGEYTRYGALHADGTPYRAEEYPLVRTLRGGGLVDQEETFYRRGDGRVTTLSVSTAPVPGPDGEIALAVTTFQDIAERKAMEAALRTAKEEADRANQAKTRFLAAASHDLRQPLQSLLLFLSVLRGEVSGDRGREILAHLERGLDAMKDLLDSLLDISRLDAGVIKPDIGDFPVHRLLAEVGAAFAPVAAAKGLEIAIRACEVTVRSDHVLLGRMVGNLVDNAVRYTRTGGIRIGCRVGADRLRIEVEDTGVGIAPDQLHRIWEEFQQIGNPERNRANGFGLGLAIVRRLSQLLGHAVEVSSSPGRGSVFRIEVPLGSSPPPAPPTRSRPAVDGANRLVVLVDDEPLVLEALKETFAAWEFEVLAGDTADGVLERLGVLGRRPDVIVADYQLGHGRTGIEVVLDARAMFGGAVPGLILTGETDPDSAQEAISCGIEIIHKPVSPQELTDAVAKLLT